MWASAPACSPRGHHRVASLGLRPIHLQLKGLSLEDTALAAIRAGAITCQSEDANCAELATLPGLMGY